MTDFFLLILLPAYDEIFLHVSFITFQMKKKKKERNNSIKEPEYFARRVLIRSSDDPGTQ